MVAKRYLAIETSSPRLSLALGDEKRRVASYHGPHDWRHAESLFDGAQKLLKKARWPIQSLSGVAVCIGPGSFTGIRIGLACARAIGQSLGIPVVGISSLELLAAGARTRHAWRAPHIDALRGQLYAALFKQEGQTLRRIAKEHLVDGADWPKVVKRMTKQAPVWHSNSVRDFPDADTLLDLARPRFARAGKTSYESVLPLYIRRSSAEERRG